MQKLLTSQVRSEEGGRSEGMLHMIKTLNFIMCPSPKGPTKSPWSRITLGASFLRHGLLQSIQQPNCTNHDGIFYHLEVRLGTGRWFSSSVDNITELFRIIK